MPTLTLSDAAFALFRLLLQRHGQIDVMPTGKPSASWSAPD